MRSRLSVLVAAVAIAGALVTPLSAGAEVKAAKSLDVSYQVQETGYWCGPAATRIAQSARTSDLPSQAALAEQLGTTENGTDHISQVVDVLNANLGGGEYQVTEMPDDPPSQAQKDKLWQDIVSDIDGGYAVVTNIVAPPGNHPPGYPDETIYHYFTVIGYDSSNMTVHIADPANFGGNQLYWLSFDQLATLVPPKGYAA
ncbi:C39 family peptidase [Amycolatopsis nigrescens]|uniref:C39 family peptidase n=1 Tax=Amycolatopsis nigrescens TaxID=381445 RepID=UPI00039DE02A|nr:C39 family peptidase [Amycolatopsis nigrescens]